MGVASIGGKTRENRLIRWLEHVFRREGAVRGSVKEM